MTAQEQYIKSISAASVKACKGTGLFPSVMIAQAIFESGWGKSQLATKYNNHFGIKADKSWTGPKVNLTTMEFINGKFVSLIGAFRSYSNPAQSFADRIKFLKENPRYTKAGVFTAKTPEEQAQALQTAGYGTDPNYAKKIIDTINKYNLKQYDKQAAQRAGTGVILGIVLVLVVIFNYKKIMKL